MDKAFVRALRRVIGTAGVLFFFAAGLLGAKAVNFEVSHPCSRPTQLVWAPDVQTPVLYGLLSGLTLGKYPSKGFGQAQACLDVDAGRGISQAQWPLMVRATAKTWAFARAVGFALVFALLWWALSWVWRAARVLLCSDSKPRKATS